MDLRREVEALKTRRRNVRPAELHRLLNAAGFERLYGKGDHWRYVHDGYPRTLVIDPRSPLLPAYVTLAIKAIEWVLRNDAT